MTEAEYIEQAKAFQEKEKRFPLQAFPCLGDDTSHGFDQHYVYHVAWAMKKVREINPAHHVDIGSSLHFCTSLAPFYPVTYMDYRSPRLHVDRLRLASIDLAKETMGSFESLSCLHVVEHIGLGRYGDTLDNEGDIKAMNNLKRMAKKDLLFVVPVGKPTVYFNAHRVYCPAYIREFFSEFDCEFYLIPNTSELPRYTEPTPVDYSYACGCFHFRRRA
jgi:hypothetical protein